MAAPVARVLLPALNHVVAAESWAQERLRSHAGAHVSIVAGPIEIALQIDAKGLFRAADGGIRPDVILTLPTDTPLRLLADRASAFARIRLDGSVEIAESLAFVFRNLRWDAEGDLAQLVGDIAAHRIVRHGRALADGLGGAVRKLGENIAEYAKEDASLLVSRRELDGFAEACTGLHARLESLESRLERLSRR